MLETNANQFIEKLNNQVGNILSNLQASKIEALVATKQNIIQDLNSNLGDNTKFLVVNVDEENLTISVDASEPSHEWALEAFSNEISSAIDAGTEFLAGDLISRLEGK